MKTLRMKYGTTNQLSTRFKQIPFLLYIRLQPFRRERHLYQQVDRNHQQEQGKDNNQGVS